MRRQNLIFVGAWLTMRHLHYFYGVCYYRLRKCGASVAVVNVWSEIGKSMFVVDFVHRSITFHIVFQEL